MDIKEVSIHCLWLSQATESLPQSRYVNFFCAVFERSTREFLAQTCFQLDKVHRLCSDLDNVTIIAFLRIRCTRLQSSSLLLITYA